MYRLMERNIRSPAPLPLPPLTLLSRLHPSTFLHFFCLNLPPFSRHPSSSILLCFFLTFSLSFTYFSWRHKEAQRIRTPQDATTWFDVCANLWGRLRNYKFRISCRNRFCEPSNYRLPFLNLYCQTLERGTITIQPRFCEVHFNFNFTSRNVTDNKVIWNLGISL